MNILIIEDEYSLADAVAETLKNESFNVCIKTNGEDGEDEALTENYDLILLDVMLPKKNGFEILKYLRKEKIKTPVIMLTAKSEIIAIGDGGNDIPMFEVSGLKIAMQNSIDIVKEKADYITSSNNESGVAKAIKKFIFNENV